ncbi:unnamed protein product, partial [Allacma fusca]
MEGEFGEVRRSQRLLGIPPENCAFTLPGLQRGQRNGETVAAETNQESLIQFPETLSVATGTSHRRSNRIGKAEEQFLLTKQRLQTEKKIEEKRLEMEKFRIDEGLEDEINDHVSVFQIPEMFASDANRLTVEPSLLDFQAWLAEEAITASLMPSNVMETEEKVKFEHKGKEKKVVFTAVNKVDKGCYHCTKEGHGLLDCKEFQKVSTQLRWKTVKTNNLCYSCLAKGADCKKKVTCGIDDCERNHHKLLHKTEE